MPRTPPRHPPEHETDRNGFTFLAIFIVCTAVFLGVYFVRLNLEVDRERAALAERLVRCREQRPSRVPVEPPAAALRADCSSLEAEFMSRFGYAR